MNKKNYVLGRKLYNMDEDTTNPKCYMCGKECSLIAFKEMGKDIIEGAKEKGFYMGKTPEGEHIMALCMACSDPREIEE